MGTVNGDAFILHNRAGALANYPHMRRARGLLHVSGLSSRRADNTHEGVTIHTNPDGTTRVEKDIREQTRAVIRNMEYILKTGGAGLEHVVDVTCYLVDMQDYGGFNEVLIVCMRLPDLE